jgi:hypothetical protein
MTQSSPLYRLIEHALDVPLADFVAERRQRFHCNSWQEIADELKERTGETVSRELLRRWFPEHAPSKSSASVL